MNKLDVIKNMEFYKSERHEESNVYEEGDLMIIEVSKSDTILLKSSKFPDGYLLGHIEKYNTIDKNTYKVLATSFSYICHQLSGFDIIPFTSELSDSVSWAYITNLDKMNIHLNDDYNTLKDNYFECLNYLKNKLKLPDSTVHGLSISLEDNDMPTLELIATVNGFFECACIVDTEFKSKYSAKIDEYLMYIRTAISIPNETHKTKVRRMIDVSSSDII